MRASLVVAFIVAGCAHRVAPVQAPSHPTETLAFEIAEVSLRDTRVGVGPALFETPLFSDIGEGETRQVPLTFETEAELKRRLSRVFVGGAQRVNVEITLRHGTTGWKCCTGVSETTSAAARLAVLVTRADTGAVVASALGEASRSVAALDIADDDPSRLFQATVLAAFDRAMLNPAMALQPTPPAL